ncbi:type I-F CRISPR-associated endoribonuclease Cas6/Csy4 [Salmonella enterica subsp. enterica serovar Nigeria]|nr:type I-F CRISPR-associated endoribonuclease Cas6/Csy4 [Salmonella enterica subsp. enterica serovar Nigeria]
MDSYIDIEMLPDHEFTASAVLSKLWFKFHIALVQSGAQIGISFPRRTGKDLGAVLRLHGTADALNTLQTQRWAKGVYDYIATSDVLPVPADVQHGHVSRAYFKNNHERLRRRADRRGNLSEEDRNRLFTAWNEKKPDCPAVEIFSSSTAMNAVFYIRHTSAPAAQAGTFNTYGLSKSATVPLF